MSVRHVSFELSYLNLDLEGWMEAQWRLSGGSVEAQWRLSGGSVEDRRASNHSSQSCSRRRGALALCICVLPWDNVKLPGATPPLIPWLASIAFVCWTFSRIMEWQSPRMHACAVWWMVFLISAYGWLVSCFASAILNLNRSLWLAIGTLEGCWCSAKRYRSHARAMGQLFATSV